MLSYRSSSVAGFFFGGGVVLGEANLMIQSHQRKMKYCTKKKENAQLINSKVSGCRSVVCEECACLRPRLTHQASLSSIFSSTSSLRFSSPLLYIKSLIFIHSDLTFQLESSPSPTTLGDRWETGREG